jgi:alpha-D-xyloside xylohydrolase
MKKTLRACLPVSLLCLLLLTFLSPAQAQWREKNAIVNVNQTPEGLVITEKTGTLRINVLSDTVLHLVYSLEAVAPKSAEYAVVKTDADFAKTPFTVEQNPQEVVLKTAKIKAVINREDSQINYSELDGKPLLADADRWLEPTVVNGEKTMKSEVFFPVYGSQEAIYGLGQHQAGVWNYRGDDINLSQENTDIAIPFWVSTNGYGVLWNNNSRSRWNNRFANYLYVSAEVAQTIDYYFIYGPEFDQVIAGYRELTGSAPMFGKWAYGFWQCKNRYKSQQELLDIASKYRELHIPMDGLVQDWFWWDRKGHHIFNTNYPDPKAMVEQLHKMNVHLMISVWPYFEPPSPEYSYMDKQGWLLDKFKYEKMPYHHKGMAAYDATNPEARKYYWNNINEHLFKLGIDAWWMDTVEPETEGMQENLVLHNKLWAGSGSNVANIYPLMTEEGVYKGQRAADSSKRVFILGRSAFTGSQRNAVLVWSGDVIANWVTLQRQVPAGLNYSASGLPYWTTDIAGFVGGSPSDPAYRELFTRWFQFGTFNPILRVHGTRSNPDSNELWAFGAETQKTLVYFDKLRYRLLPYTYSLAWKTTNEGYTPMRALTFDFRNDEMAQMTGDEFLYGPALLVNPVTTPGAASRNVYLPKATWYNFWSGEAVEGGKTISAEAPIERLPLFVRAGSILPMGPEVEWASQKAADPIELRVYRGANGSFSLYEDEGDSYNYEKGAYATIPLTWNESAQTLTIGERTGSFPGMLASRTFRVVFVDKNHGTGAETTATADQTVSYSGHAITVKP